VRDHLRAMTEPHPSQVLGGLPRSRPHRRSQRRPAVQPIREPAGAQATGESTGKAALPNTKTKAGAADPAARAAGGAAKPQAGASAPKRKNRAATVAKPSSQIAPTGRATTTTTSEAAPTSAVPTTAMPQLTPPVTPGAKATRTDVVATAVQAAAELAEIGLTFGARTLRNALSRLPHP
jgi:hypothetical protein